MELNVVKVPEDTDFERVKTLCDNHQGWLLAYHKKTTRVWTKPQLDSDLHMIKARSDFVEVSAAEAYDVLHDPQYRLTWDKYMLGSKDVGLLNPNNDIGYYALRSFPPFRNRDFVLQRSWLDLGDEKLIFSHSVCHDDFPPKPGCIRAVVYLTGYLIRRLEPTGCQVTYFTHSDPKGRLPTWMVNKLTKIVAPKVIKRLHQACVAYPAWKSTHSPDWKPWSYPEQQTCMARVSLDQCRPRTYDQELIDESQCADRTTVEEDD